MDNNEQIIVVIVFLITILFCCLFILNPCWIVHLYISCSGVLPAGTPFYSSVTQNGSSNGPQKYKDRYIPPTYSPIELHTSAHLLLFLHPFFGTPPPYFS